MISVSDRSAIGATLMVAGNIPGNTQTLSIAIYDAVQADNPGLANILVLIMTGFAIAVLWTVNRFTQGSTKSVRKAHRRQRLSVRIPSKKTVFQFCLRYRVSDGA